MTSLRELKSIRATTKGQMTRIKNALEVENVEITTQEAQLRARKLEELYMRFDDVQTKIEALREPTEELSQEQIDGENAGEREVLESIYNPAATKLQIIITAAYNAAAQRPVIRPPQENEERLPTERTLGMKLPDTRPSQVTMRTG